MGHGWPEIPKVVNKFWFNSQGGKDAVIGEVW